MFFDRSHPVVLQYQLNSHSVKTQQYIQQCKVCYMFQLQVTIVRQTFQYMDTTCSVLTVWDTILFTFAV
jgi:hypothetical protein